MLHNNKHWLAGWVIFAAVLLTAIANADEEDVVEDNELEISYGIMLSNEQWQHVTLNEVPRDNLRERTLELTTSLSLDVSSELSIFAEVNAFLEYYSDDLEEVSDTQDYLERGQMWLLWQQDFANNSFAIQVGRQEFADERLWWWDEDLDAIRLQWDYDDWWLELALAQELARHSTLDTRIDPEEKGLFRTLALLGWDWAEDHQLQIHALLQTDGSTTPNVGDTVAEDDASDADLGWLGLRVSGEWTLTDDSSLAYRIQGARLWGSEQLLEFDDDSVVVDRQRHNVRGWALDAGIDWLLSEDNELTLSVNYAIGSGDDNLDDDQQRTFRQTGLHGNEDDYHYYGELFDPELSNLRVFSTAISWSPVDEGSFTIAYHRYRQDVASDELTDSAIERDPNGELPSLGEEWDIIFKLEMDNDISVEAIASMFRAGRAFGSDRGERAYRTYLQLEYEF